MSSPEIEIDHLEYERRWAVALPPHDTQTIQEDSGEPSRPESSARDDAPPAAG